MKKKYLFFILPLFIALVFMGCTFTDKADNSTKSSSVDVNVLSPNKSQKLDEKPKEEPKTDTKTPEQPKSQGPVLEKPKPPETFKKGDSGDAIKVIQQKLNKFGYDLTVDGDFGPSTNFAVVDFQKRNKLTANGIVDSNTLKCLEKKPTAETTFKPPTPAPKTQTNDTNTIEQYINIRSFISKTNYFIWIDLSKQRVNIFSGSSGKWKLIKSFVCSSGKPSTPTVKGLFTVGSKGSYFIADGGARCKYYTQISGNYLFHSILYDNKGEKIVDGRLGIPLSHGCVRLAVENAKYIYDTIPRGTLIWSN